MRTKPDEVELMVAALAVSDARPYKVFGAQARNAVGMDVKRFCFIVEKWVRRDWAEYGVSYSGAWLTSRGVAELSRLAPALIKSAKVEAAKRWIAAKGKRMDERKNLAGEARALGKQIKALKSELDELERSQATWAEARKEWPAAEAEAIAAHLEARRGATLAAFNAAQTRAAEIRAISRPEA